MASVILPTYHLASTDHTQRLNLGSACSSSGAKAAGRLGAIAENQTKRGSKHYGKERDLLYSVKRERRKAKVHRERVQSMYPHV